MRKLLILMALALIAVGCTPVICREPYIQVGTGCCLDTNSNKICDSDEVVQEKSANVEIEGTVPPPEIQPEKPAVEEPPVQPEKIEIPELITNNEAGTVINEVSLRPACLKGSHGGEIFFKVGTVPSSIKVNVKESGKSYESVFTRPGLYDGYIYFAICDNCYDGDFQLKPGKVYVIDLEFNQTKVYDRIEYSNEHLIDTRPDSDYMKKYC